MEEWADTLVTVEGHEWGKLADDFSTRCKGEFTRILCADCLWMEGEHDNLLQSMKHFLAISSSARVWVVAGFHTGRSTVVKFFDKALKVGFDTEEIWEQDVNGIQRPWRRHRGGIEEDIEERRKWLVIAILKRKL